MRCKVEKGKGERWGEKVERNGRRDRRRGRKKEEEKASVF